MQLVWGRYRNSVKRQKLVHFIVVLSQKIELKKHKKIFLFKSNFPIKHHTNGLLILKNLNGNRKSQIIFFLCTLKLIFIYRQKDKTCHSIIYHQLEIIYQRRPIVSHSLDLKVSAGKSPFLDQMLSVLKKDTQTKKFTNKFIFFDNIFYWISSKIVWILIS